MTRPRNPCPGVTRSLDRRGRVRWRFRAGVVDCYLPGDYGSAAFTAADEAARQGKRPDGKATHRSDPHGMFGWVIERYKASGIMQTWAPIARRDLTLELERFCVDHGHRLVAEMRWPHVEKMMHRKAATPAAANKLLKLIRRLVRFSIRLELIQRHVTMGIKLRSVGLDGYHTWIDSELKRFRRCHDTRPVSPSSCCFPPARRARTRSILDGRTSKAGGSSSSAARRPKLSTCRSCRSSRRSWRTLPTARAAPMGRRASATGFGNNATLRPSRPVPRMGCAKLGQLGLPMRDAPRPKQWRSLATGRPTRPGAMPKPRIGDALRIPHSTSCASPIQLKTCPTFETGWTKQSPSPRITRGIEVEWYALRDSNPCYRRERAAS